MPLIRAVIVVGRSGLGSALSIEKLSGLGWDIEFESDQAVRETARELIEEME